MRLFHPLMLWLLLQLAKKAQGCLTSVLALSGTLCEYWIRMHHHLTHLLSSRRVHTFTGAALLFSANFNRHWTRLLGGYIQHPPVVFDVPTSFDVRAAGSVRLLAQDYSIPGFGRNNLCFAGEDNELVVSTSADNSLYVWSLPNSHQVRADQTVNQSLLVLRGHTGDIYNVRYDSCNDTFASAGFEETIKLWTLAHSKYRIFWKNLIGQ